MGDRAPSTKTTLLASGRISGAVKIEFVILALGVFGWFSLSWLAVRAVRNALCLPISARAIYAAAPFFNLAPSGRTPWSA